MARRDRTPMPMQDPDVRARNFDQVALGYTEDMAVLEAERCIQCKTPLCMTGCPVAVQIPRFIGLMKERKFQDAIDVIKETNNLPAVCGRVCPQEIQCEAKCILGRAGKPVAIGRLERFAADWGAKHGTAPADPLPLGDDAKKVAIIGAGPSGLTAAGDLAKLGYDVTVFESLHEPGGVLAYGIPEFRLPKSVVREEVEYVRGLGAKIVTDVVVGRTLSVEDLFDDGFEAVYVGTGAGLPMFMKIPGENLNGVYSANEWLTRINLMHANLFPKWDTPVKKGHRVAVVGGGNVAMDAVRAALRLGAEEASIIYRRGREEMPARGEEVENAEEEGVTFRLLTNPVEVEGEGGWVTGLRCVKMELGEPDKSGRRRPVPVEGSEFTVPCDIVVMALGTNPNPILAQTTSGLDAQPWGGLLADESTGRTTRERVWAGGDAVTGSATVILAMGAGKAAAKDIHKYLSEPGGTW